MYVSRNSTSFANDMRINACNHVTTKGEKRKRDRIVCSKRKKRNEKGNVNIHYDTCTNKLRTHMRNSSQIYRITQNFKCKIQILFTLEQSRFTNKNK